MPQCTPTQYNNKKDSHCKKFGINLSMWLRISNTITEIKIRKGKGSYWIIKVIIKIF
jgi:hypothetical protein